MTLRVGDTVQGRYRLVDLIATGGMGQVWQASDADIEGRTCALKILRDEYAGDEVFLNRFRAEAKHTAALTHEGIAALYDYGEVDGRAFIVMELVPGRPLSDIIEEHPDGMDQVFTMQVMRQVAYALQAAHRAGVVHRDIKPENILVDDESGEPRVKITDFGIARSEDQAKLTKTGLVMGTAQYLSPEQAMGKAATNLSDIYSLGIVGYEMLTGRRPFTGASQVEIAMAQVKKRVPPMPEDIDRELRKLVEMCLAKAPANRPRTAQAVAESLIAIEAGEEPDYGMGVFQPPLTQPIAPKQERKPAVQPRSRRERSHSRTSAMPAVASQSRPVRHRAATGAQPVLSARSEQPQPLNRSRRSRFTLPGIVLAVLLLIVIVMALVNSAGGFTQANALVFACPQFLQFARGVCGRLPGRTDTRSD
ncbi:serine/threonine-protein kinase [Dermabacteraceae bacterium P9123]